MVWTGYLQAILASTRASNLSLPPSSVIAFDCALCRKCFLWCTCHSCGPPTASPRTGTGALWVSTGTPVTPHGQDATTTEREPFLFCAAATVLWRGGVVTRARSDDWTIGLVLPTHPSAAPVAAARQESIRRRAPATRAVAHVVSTTLSLGMFADCFKLRLRMCSQHCVFPHELILGFSL